MSVEKVQMSELTILGSGTSTGIPMVGCNCEVCTSPNKKNTRLRSSIYLNLDGTKILIDTTPDLRTQLLTYAIDHVDGAIITHDHADHLHGIDDLRPLSFKTGSIPVFTDDKTAKSIENRFDYIFDHSKPALGGGKPRLELKHLIIPQLQLSCHDICGKIFTFFKLPHGHGHTLGFQVETMAYIIDCHEVPLQIVNYLAKEKLELLIIDCCQIKEHKTHLNQRKSFDYIEKIAPQSAGLIHMNHSLEHEKLAKDASQHFTFPVSPLHDGQIITFNCNS